MLPVNDRWRTTSLEHNTLPISIDWSASAVMMLSTPAGMPARWASSPKASADNGVASAGFFFPFLSAFLGWLAVFLSGSDTSGNALFGNLQVVAARELNLDPVLMAATNSSGGVLGKMISPQNVTTGTSITGLAGREGEVVARTFKHSIILTMLLGLLVMAQQYLFPWMIPK